MKKFVKIMALLLCMTLMVSALAACGKQEAPAVTEAPAATEAASTETEATEAPEASEAQSGFYQIGDKIDDFTVTTYDGKQISLYKVLEEKDMVLLNIWATWCGPCGSEFPAMQEAYEKYQDKVEIIALSCEPTDTDEVLAAYAQEKGMTFCVTRDSVGLSYRVDSNSIPTTLIVDRFGIICMIESGAMPDAAIFENVFGFYTAEDYEESVFMPHMMSQLYTGEVSDPAKVNEALNAEDAELVFAGSENPFHWPMNVEEMDGRTVVAASNAGSEYSVGTVMTQVDVKAGDVLVLDYKLKSEIYTSYMSVEVDGKSVKQSATNKDWTSFAYKFEEDGTHEVKVTFNNSWISDAKANGLWIDSIRVVTGEQALKALEANPQYPVAEKTQMQLLNENAQTARIYAENNPADEAVFLVCADETYELLITLDNTMDPETAFLIDGNYDFEALIAHATKDGFLMEVANVGDEAMVNSPTLYCGGEAVDNMTIFASEEAVSAYCELVGAMYGESYLWEYVDASALNASGEATYTVTYVDQNGDPVPGVMCQVCDESTCQVFASDANGVCQFTLPAKEYEIHTLMVPAGYEGDTTTVTKVTGQGGELSFTLTKK